MKTGYLTTLSVLSLLIATPVLADITVSKTDNGVKVECEINGSDHTGWSIRGINSEAKKKTCTVKCVLTKKTGGTHTVEAKSRPVRESPLITQMEGDVPAKLGGFTAAKITEAVCKNAS